MFKPLSLRVICHTELEADAGHRVRPDHRRRKRQQVHSGKAGPAMLWENHGVLLRVTLVP